MSRRSTRLVAFPAIALLLTACGEAPIPSAPLAASGGRADVIGTTPHFFFLPPLAPRRSFTGVFDASLSPVVDVCLWNGSSCATPAVARLTDVRLRAVGDIDDPSDDGSQPRYSAVWKTRGLRLDPAKSYRLRVLVAGTELGFADLKVVRNERDARLVDASQYVPVVADRDLRVNFRIEKGAVTVVGAAGGTVADPGGGANIVIPAGALSGDVGITIEPSAVPAVQQGFLVPGTGYEFGPHGLTFATPAQITIHYDESAIPAGHQEGELRLMHYVNGAWQNVPGSTVDRIGNTVTGPATSFSNYGVGSSPAITMSGWGTATIDGLVAGGFLNAEWNHADCQNFPLALSGGNGMFCVMNDYDNVYVAVTYGWRAPMSGDTYAFNVDLERVNWFRNPGDDSFRFDQHYVGVPIGTFSDQFLRYDPVCGTPDFLCPNLDVNDGGTTDGAGAFMPLNGVHGFELSHPLASLDASHDVTKVAGDTVGFTATLDISSAGQTNFLPYPGRHGQLRIIGVDQHQDAMDVAIGNWAIGGSSEQILAQVVTPAVSGELVEISLPVSCASGRLVVQIRDVVNGQPGSTILNETQVSSLLLPDFYPNPPGFRRIALADTTQTLVTAGVPYAIVLSNPAGTCGIPEGPLGDPYPGGDGWFDSRPNTPGIWVQLGDPIGSRKDLPFKTVVK